MSFFCGFLDVNCSRIFQGYPSGGILLVVAVTLLAIVTAILRTKLRDWISTSWQALIALTIGAGGYILDGGRAIPLFLGISTALLCLLWRSLIRNNHPLGIWLVHYVNRLPGVSRLPRPSPYAFLLGAGLFFYTFGQLGTWGAETYWAKKLVKDEGEFFVSFSMPPHNNNPMTVDSYKSLEKNLFSQLNGALRDSFSHLTTKTIVLPEKKLLKDYPRLRTEFPPGPENRSELTRKILTYRQGVGSRVDLALEPSFNEVSSKQKQFRYRFRLYKLDHAAETLERLNWRVELYGLADEVRRAALVAVAELVIFVVGPDLKLSKKEEGLLWKKLIKDFKDYYESIDSHSEKRLLSWKGDDPAKKADCNGKDCLEQWVRFYRRDLPEQDEESNRKTQLLKSQMNTIFSPIRTSAGERTGRP